jgi:hypothetical protein
MRRFRRSTSDLAAARRLTGLPKPRAFDSEHF